MTGSAHCCLGPFWGARLVWSFAAPIFQAIGVNGFVFDRRAIVFTLVLTALTTLVFGVLPALRGSKVDVALVLKGSTAGAGKTRRGRMSGTLVVGQVALCVFTMIGSALVLQSFLHFLRVSADPGFEPRSLLVATLPHAPHALSAYYQDSLDPFDDEQVGLQRAQVGKRFGSIHLFRLENRRRMFDRQLLHRILQAAMVSASGAVGLGEQSHHAVRRVI